MANTPKSYVYSVILGTEFNSEHWDKMAEAIKKLGDDYEVSPKGIREESQRISVTRKDNKKISRADVDILYNFCLGVAVALDIPTKHRSYQESCE